MRTTHPIAVRTAVLAGVLFLSVSALMADDAQKIQKIIAAAKTPDDLKELLKDKGKNLSKEQKQMIREKVLALRGKANPKVEAPAPAPAAPAAKVEATFEKIQPIDAQKITQLVDRRINDKLTAAGMPVSPQADDAEFLRRVYLDIAGVIPSAEQSIAFLDSKDPHKRAKLIDELLASDEYARHMADVWLGLLIERTSDNRRIGIDPLRTWLETRFEKNEGWDKIVRELLTASGTQEENGASTFFLTTQTVDKMTDQTCSLFLGVQLQCAQCHNHPFTDWKQTEYWGMAQFFMRVRLDGEKGNVAKSGKTPTVSESVKGRPKNLPEATKQVAAKFLGAEEPKLPTSDPIRPLLANWIGNRNNPFFAKAMVNRTWAQLFGRGFVNPIDDMHDENPATHPELLQELAKEFADSGFDLKQLIRGICNSQTYQRSSKPTGDNVKDKDLYSHMAIKVLSPEQLYDSLTKVIGSQQAEAVRAKAQKGQANGPRERFVTFFSVADVPSPTEYEAGIPQALKLMNSPQLSQAPRLVTEIARNQRTPIKVLESLYLTALARRPTSAEQTRMLSFITQSSDPASAYGDVLWVLLNSSEFTLNR